MTEERKAPTGLLARLKAKGEELQKKGRERIREGLRPDPKKAPAPSEEERR